jgi:hypothetical protein
MSDGYGGQTRGQLVAMWAVVIPVILFLLVALNELLKGPHPAA